MALLVQTIFGNFLNLSKSVFGYFKTKKTKFEGGKALVAGQVNKDRFFAASLRCSIL